MSNNSTAPVNYESLLAIGFIKSQSFGRKRASNELNFRGAPLWWDGNVIRYRREIVPANTIDDVLSFIRSLRITPGRGKKPL